MPYEAHKNQLMGTLLSAAMMLGAAAAHAGAGEMQTLVVPLQENITYSSDGPPPLHTYIGYQVTVTNAGGNTINNIRFTGGTAVTDPAEQAQFASADGATCTTTNTAGTEIDCTIGQLKAGTGYPTFAVFFKAPVRVANGVADTADSDSVAFSGTTYYAEGTGGVPQSPPDNSTLPWTTAEVALGTSNPTLVKSAVQSSGADLFTGNGGTPTATDPFATRIIVQGNQSTYTTAQIQESPTSDPNCNSFITCWISVLTIPGTFSPYLSVELKIDAANIKPGTKISSVIVEYQYHDSSNVLQTYIVGDCPNATTPLSNGLPCIARRVYYKNRSTPGWSPELDGDFGLFLIGTKNGTWRPL